MMRSHVAFAWAVPLVWMVACVNVDKPSKVAKCEQPGSNCAPAGRDGSAEALRNQDADENDDLAQEADGPAVAVADAAKDGTSDLVLDVPPAVFRDAGQDVAQDVGRDGATDQPVGLCWGASGPAKAGVVTSTRRQRPAVARPQVTAISPRAVPVPAQLVRPMPS